MKRLTCLPLQSARAGLLSLALLTALAAVWPVMVPMARADAAVEPAKVKAESAAERQARAAQRDSLRAELRRYARIANALRDSVAGLEGDESAAMREVEIEATIDELSESLNAISEEIAGLDLQVFDNAIRLRDKHGGSVSITIPENLDENVSRGLGYLSRVILDELPDTVSVVLPREIKGALDVAPAPPPPPGNRRVENPATPATPATPPLARILNFESQRKKRVIEGDLVKVRDDVVVQPGEVVRGNVVVVMGDALIEGQVDGDVVVVLGDLQLGDDASVAGRVVTVLGRIDRDEDAEVGSVVVVNPGSMLDLDVGDLAAGKGSWVSFVVGQVFLLLVVLLVIVLLVSVPASRLATTAATLARRPAECFGLGLLVAIAGHVILATLLGVLVLTVIGIPVALLAILGLMLLDLLAVGVVCVNLGSWLCRRFGLSCQRTWVMAVLGMLAVHVPSFLAGLVAWQGGAAPVASALFVLGVAAKLGVYLLGLGALVVSRLGTREPVEIGEGLEPLPSR